MRFPIQAPLMPRLNRTNGAMQHDDAPMAPRMPPIAVSRSAVAVPASSGAGRDVARVNCASWFTRVHGCFLHSWTDATIRSRYRVKGRGFTKMRTLTIAKLAGASGVHLETVRYYERIGLMPKPARTASGYRSYGEEQVQQLSFIRRAREIGFCIAGIKELLILAEPGRASCAEVQTLTAAHLDGVRAKIADLQKLEAILAGALEQCLMEPAPACPVLDMLASPRIT